MYLSNRERRFAVRACIRLGVDLKFLIRRPVSIIRRGPFDVSSVLLASELECELSSFHHRHTPTLTRLTL